MKSLIAVALVATIVYLNSLSGGFVSDDNALILEHPYTKRIADWPAILLPAIMQAREVIGL